MRDRKTPRDALRCVASRRVAPQYVTAFVTFVCANGSRVHILEYVSRRRTFDPFARPYYFRFYVPSRRPSPARIGSRRRRRDKRAYRLLFTTMRGDALMQRCRDYRPSAPRYHTRARRCDTSSDWVAASSSPPAHGPTLVIFDALVPKDSWTSCARHRPPTRRRVVPRIVIACVLFLCVMMMRCV